MFNRAEIVYVFPKQKSTCFINTGDKRETKTLQVGLWSRFSLRLALLHQNDLNEFH